MVTIGDLPPDVLEEVLSRVPGRDLVCNCRLVCLQWRDVVDLPALWKRKCQREGFGLAMSDRSILDWKTFYFLCSLKRNLIKNPCGEKGLKFWEFKSKKKKVWKIEKAPEAEVYFPNIRKCFVAYHLYYFSPNYRYELCVKLLSEDFSLLQECRPEGVFRNQWRDEDKWCEVSYTFHNYPAGVRHIRFIHGTEGWTYMRVTNSSVTIGPEAAQRRKEPETHLPDQL
ncbi:F-box only protein 6-like isoform X2 [Sphaerodactylus townsendi]|uniref:F-box only protein 6-like isoform X2 n=1 Tax=Sphaerodactylus townsendi TaxID=933632 RepID=UPI002026CA47|nr:F-box only protein 6-like isoform X2 [Sphaerodactylus townsendi]